MRTWQFGLALGLGLGLAPLAPARALVVAPPPLPTRVAQADAVLVGRVIGVEPRDVEAAPFPGSPQKVPYRVAVVQVDEALRGVKAKTVRVGYPAPPPEIAPGAPNAGVIRIRPGGFRRGLTFDVGQTGLFLLAKHPQEDFYTANFGNFVPSQNNPNFDKEVAGVKKLGQLLANPQAGLKAADAEERYLAASLLVAQYRTPKGGANRQEPIPAAESKQILTALADADWAGADVGGTRTHPIQLFHQLGITPQDGWQPPANLRDQQDLARAMQTWLREHADTFRLKRFVP